MEMTTEAYLKGPIWNETLNKLVGTVFATQWDVYALCIAVGMMFDCQIETDEMLPENYEGDNHSVARNVLSKAQNKSLIEFMYQSALITTKHLDLDEEARLSLAFDTEKNATTNPIPFLTKFANYGVTKLKEVIADVEDVELLESLMTFLNSTYESGADNLEEAIVLDEILLSDE